MKDCLLALFWPRKDLVGFFADHGCSSSDLKRVRDYQEKSFSRAQIVDEVFDHLSARPDGGVGQFRAMLHALVNWSHFDPYYFDELKKLDRKVALERLRELRRIQESRDDRIREHRQRRSTTEQAAEAATAALCDLKDSFLTLYATGSNAQKRGYLFEKLLRDLAQLSGLPTTEAFRVHGEQIDGAVKFDGEHYVIEAKWQDAAASNEPLYQFAQKVEGKMYGRGIFVSINGFSSDVVRGLVIGKAIRTILVDGEDLTLVLEDHLSLTQMIDSKVRAAQTKGLIYVHPLTGKSKM